MEPTRFMGRRSYKWTDLTNLLWPLRSSTANKPPKYTAYVVEAGGGGDCQFHAIALGLQSAVLETTRPKLNAQHMRNITAMSLDRMSKDEFDAAMASYASEQESGSLDVSWDPSSIKNREQFKSIVTIPGFTFQGDNLTLAILSRTLNMCFVVIAYPLPRSLPLSNNRGIMAIGDAKTCDSFMCLAFTGGHYQLVVLQDRNGDVHSVFKQRASHDPAFRRIPRSILREVQ